MHRLRRHSQIKPPKGDEFATGISDSLVELVDFYATAMDFAEAEPNHTHFGKSLKPVLENPALKVREFVCTEGGRLASEKHCDEFHEFGEKGIPIFHPYWPRLSAQTNDVAHGKGTMLRTDRFKYVARLYENDEFYDLEKDPDELVNEIDNPAYSAEIAELRQKLMRWYLETADVVPFDHDQRTSFEIVWAKVKKYVPDDKIDEIKEKIRNGANVYELINYCKETFK